MFSFFYLIFILLILLFFFFFFSSRRRHTRCLSDWSSDVCSSDLVHRDLLDLAGLDVADARAVERAVVAGQELVDHVRRQELDVLGRARTLERSEEHTSELQSLRHLVCRLLLEKKKKLITKVT